MSQGSYDYLNEGGKDVRDKFGQNASPFSLVWMIWRRSTIRSRARSRRNARLSHQQPAFCCPRRSTWAGRGVVVGVPGAASDIRETGCKTWIIVENVHSHIKHLITSHATPRERSGWRPGLWASAERHWRREGLFCSGHALSRPPTLSTAMSRSHSHSCLLTSRRPSSPSTTSGSARWPSRVMP